MRLPPSLVLTVALSAASLAAQGARFVTFGIGCPAPTPPTLSLNAAPLLGTTTTLKVSALPIDALFPFALLAGTQTNVPLDLLGAAGCTLFVDNVIVSLPPSRTNDSEFEFRAKWPGCDCFSARDGAADPPITMVFRRLYLVQVECYSRRDRHRTRPWWRSFPRLVPSEIHAPDPSK